MRKLTIVIAASLLSSNVMAENELLEHMISAPGIICDGNSSYSECITATRKLMVTAQRIGTVSTKCEMKKEDLRLLTEGDRNQCTDYKQVYDYIESISQ